VATGRALTRPDPRVLLLDEPLATADRGFRLQLREQLALLHRRSGLTILLATNDSDEAMSLADRVAVLADGRLHQVGAPTDVYFEPADTVVATTVGSLPMNLIPAAIEADAEGTWLAVGADRVAVSGLAAEWTGRRVLVGLHPSELRPAPPGTPFRRVLHATVARVEFAGGSTFVLVGLGGVAAPVFTVQVRGPFERTAGSALELTWDEERTRLFDAGTGVLLGR
jgi:multiple sugar transport system ATP-binding protein